ncbi:MAG: gliding motility-associated C-terminal domain-containing protein [Paludibacteraceae bacterium]|nr:gliding motility-associated C-terminal domain-containing protein [Paludibacteraceae bacterium]
MRKFVVAFIFCLCAFVGMHAETLSPEKKFDGNIGFITVGNTNHKLAGDVVPGAIDRDRSKENGEIVPINVANLFSGTTTNANYAEFVVDIPKEITCEDEIEILYASLFWGGRHKTSGNESVRIMVTDSVGDKIAGINDSLVRTAAVDVPVNGKNRGVYSCHAEVTNYIKKAVNVNTDDRRYRFYVADLNTSSTEVGSGAEIGKFSGWTLNIVYKHKGLPERSIYIFQPNMMGDVSGTEGVEGGEGRTDLFVKLGLGDNFKVLKDQDISFVSTFLGAYRTEVKDRIIANGDNKGSIKSQDLFVSPGTEGNCFDNTISYSYEFESGSVKSEEAYTRGYDLKAISSNLNSCLDTANRTFNFFVGLLPEIHFFTDAVLMFGQPDIPGVVAQDVSPSNVKPNESFNYSLFVGLHQNTEQLDNINVRIPLTEYVDYVEDVKLKIVDAQGESYYVKLVNKMDMSLEWKDREYRILANSVSFTSNSKTTWSKDNKSDRENLFNPALRNAMFVTDSLNLVAFLDDPLSVKQRVLKISFDSIRSLGVDDDHAIEIELTLHSKSETDWAYQKNHLLANRELPMLQQSEVTFHTPSDRNSVLQSMDTDNKYNKKGKFDWSTYICDQKGRGGIGAGGGGDLDLGGGGNGRCEKSGYTREDAAKGGVFTKDTTHVSINVKPNGEFCPKFTLPDALEFSFCENTEVSAAGIKEILKVRYRADLDSLAKRDSLIWLEAKQAMVYDYIKKYGVTRQEMEGLVNFNSVSATTDRIVNLSSCGAGTPVYDRGLDSIMNMKIEYSDIFLFYNSPAVGDLYDTPKDSVSLRKLRGDGKSWVFTDSLDLYMYYKSPWDNGACNKFIPVKIRSFKNNAPVVQYGGSTLPAKGDTTIRVCLDSNLDPFKVIKQSATHDIYVSIDGGESKPINVDPVKEFDWILKESELDTKQSGTKKFIVYGKDMDCYTDTLHFSITVSETKITEVPEIARIEGDELNGDVQMIKICKSREELDSLTINLLDPIPSYEAVWTAKTDTSLVALGKGNSINVQKDVVGTTYYSVVYANDDCVGDLKDEIRVEILPLPDTLSPDTFAICYNYELTSTDLSNAAQRSVVQSGVTLSYYDNLAKAEANQPTEVEDMAKSLNRDVLNSGYTPYYVRVYDNNECYSVPTRNEIKRNQFDLTAPKFPVDVKGVLVDSALVCLGAQPKENLNEYLSEEETAKVDGAVKQPKWMWVHSISNIPEYTPTSTLYSNVRDSYSSYLDGTAAGHDTMYVVRVDSNSCISEPKQFRLHVDSNITTLPYVDDPLMPRNGLSRLDLNYCQYKEKYKSGYIPAWGTEPGYIVEWYKVDSLTQFVEDTVVTKPFAEISFDYPDTLLYKVRQSTALGCHGKWLPVRAMIHPAVTLTPEVDMIELCKGADPVEVVVKNKPENKGLSTFFVEDGKDNDVENYLLKLYVNADEATPEDQEPVVNGYVLFKSSTTGCTSDSTPIKSRIHELPKKPVSEFKTKNFCLESGDIDLVDLFKVETVAEDVNYNSNSLVWSSVLSREPKVDPTGILSSSTALSNFLVSVKQYDNETGCEGDTINLRINVDSTFSYVHFDTTLCYGQTMELCLEVAKRIKHKKNSYVTSDIDFNVYPLSGNTPSLTPLGKSDKVKSPYERHESKLQRYLVKIWEKESGCEIEDTLSLEFRGLPVVEIKNSIDTCSMADFVLPIVTERAEDIVEWYREDSTPHSGRNMSLDKSEKPYVIVTDEYACKDTATLDVIIHVNPLKPLVSDAVICQHSGIVNLKMDNNVDPSSENTAAKLKLLVYNYDEMEKGKEVDAYVNTDKLDFTSSVKSLKYIVRQENMLTTCFDTAHINVTVRRKYTPEIPDFGPTCKDQVFDMGKYVNNYVSTERASIGIANLSTITLSYADMNGELSEAQTGAIVRQLDSDTTLYSFKITDNDKVCEVADTFMVIINEIPSAPMIEEGQDSVFLCGNGVAPLEVSAKPTNSDATNLDIWWRVNGTDYKSDTYTLGSEVSKATLKSYVKNSKTGCESDLSEIVATVVPVMAAKTLDSLILCAGEEVNVFEYLKKSFVYTPAYTSRIGYKVTENGMLVKNISELTKAKKTAHTVNNYEIEMMDTLTGCSAKNTFRVVWEDAVNNSILAKNIACQGDDASLVAVGESRPHTLKWVIDGELVGTEKQLDITSLTKTTEVKLITNISGTECSDTLTHTLTVYDTPEKLEDVPTFRFCQANESHDITLNHSEYEIEWTNARDEVNVTEFYPVSASKDTAFVLQARLINNVTTGKLGMDTVCRSTPIDVNVEVVKHINVSLADTNVCVPSTYNLMKAVQQPDLSLKVYSISPKVEDSLAVSKSALYTITYEDKWHCQTSATTDVRFISKPDSVIIAKNGFNMCLGSETVVKPVVSAGQYVIEWTNTRDKSKLISDTLAISADKESVSPIMYDVVRVDTIYGCRSVTTPFSYNVMPKISINPYSDQHVCDYETLDIDSLSKSIFNNFDDLEVTNKARKVTDDKTSLLFSAVNPVSTCTAEVSLDIITHQSPKFSVTGNHPACQGDTVVLEAVGSDQYFWGYEGNTNRAAKSFAVTSKENQDVNVDLRVKLFAPIDGDNKYCYADTSITVSFAKVPELVGGKLDTAYCQNTLINELPEIVATDPAASIVWYSYADNYTEPYVIKSLDEVAASSGDFNYKFKQVLGICSTKLQNYTIRIQPRIEDAPVLRDTVYCIDADPLLLSKSDYNNPLVSSMYDLEWSDKEEVVVDGTALPLTNEVGAKMYYARYTKGVCKGDASTIVVKVEPHYQDMPLVDELQKFCPKTGTYDLTAKTTNSSARLNWYYEFSNQRMDNITIDTDQPNWTTATYKVTQSVLDGCESMPAVFTVQLKKPVAGRDTLIKNMCLGDKFSIEELFEELSVSEVIDEVKDDKNNIIDHIIASDGTYHVDVHNEDECKAQFNVAVKTWSVGAPIVEEPKEQYCAGDKVHVSVVAPNEVDYRWYSQNEDKIVGYVSTINTVAGTESDSLFLTMSVKGHPECQSELKFEINVAPKMEFDIVGDTAICAGNEFSLSATNITNKSWMMFDTLFVTETFVYAPSKSGYVTALGIDKYGCNTQKSVLVNVYESPKPSILVGDTVDHPNFDLDRDDRDISFEAIVNADETAELVYYWEVGDGNIYDAKSFTHEYEYDFVDMIKPIPVKLRVYYEFDEHCMGNATAILRVNPDFEVPNTMGADDHFMPNYNLQIFDRVGNLIFEGRDGWKGQDMDGREVFGDTYFYAITYFIDGKKYVKNGYITLVR